MCSAGSDRAWLTKIRPWYGHDDHFHVRLACPAGNADCTPQARVAVGDGCGEELAWWFSPEATADRDKERKRYQDKVVRGPRVPEQCFALIHDKAAPDKAQDPGEGRGHRAGRTPAGDPGSGREPRPHPRVRRSTLPRWIRKTADTTV